MDSRYNYPEILQDPRTHPGGIFLKKIKLGSESCTQQVELKSESDLPRVLGTDEKNSNSKGSGAALTSAFVVRLLAVSFAAHSSSTETGKKKKKVLKNNLGDTHKL